MTTKEELACCFAYAKIKGEEEGRKEGLEKGRKEGLEEGRKEGRKEGRETAGRDNSLYRRLITEEKNHEQKKLWREACYVSAARTHYRYLR